MIYEIFKKDTKEIVATMDTSAGKIIVSKDYDVIAVKTNDYMNIDNEQSPC